MISTTRSYSMADQLEFSLARQQFDMDAIAAALPGCVWVSKSPQAEDRLGVDYWATLRCGRDVGVEAKTREAGALLYWKRGVPELALEVWSNIERQIPGWTLDDRKRSEYVLFTFADISTVYLIPFPQLRLAFSRNGRRWARQYRWARQKTTEGNYHSACVFVPAPVVIAAVAQEMTIDLSAAEGLEAA